jgi:hypothetical protein
MPPLTFQIGSSDHSNAMVPSIIGGIICLVILCGVWRKRRSRRTTEKVDDLIKDEPARVQDLQRDNQPNTTIASYNPPAQEVLTPTFQNAIIPLATPVPLPAPDVELHFQQRLIELQDESVRAQGAERAREQAERTRLEAEQALAAYQARQRESVTGDVPPPYTFV